MTTKPTLIIPYQVSAILDYLAKENKDEWQCFCPIKELVGNKFIIENSFVFPKQENSGGATESTEAEYVEIASQLENWDNMIWIHSHNSMSAFWSTTDHTQMELQAQMSGTHTFSLVVNNRGDRKASLNMWRPIKDLFDMDIEIEFPLIGDDVLKAHQEVLNSVQRKKVVTTYPRQTSWAVQNSYSGFNKKVTVPAKEATKCIDNYYPHPNKKTKKLLKYALDSEFTARGYEVTKEDCDLLEEYYRFNFSKNVDVIPSFVKLFIEEKYEGGVV